MYFVVMFGCCSMFILLFLDGYLLLIAECGHLWIACHFQTVTPIPVFFISFSSDFISYFQWNTWFFQVEARFMHFLSYLAFCIPHRIPHSISYLHCVVWVCTWLIVPFLLVCLVWVEPGDEFANEEPVEFAFEDPVNSDNCAGKMIIPLKSLLSLLC